MKCPFTDADILCIKESCEGCLIRLVSIEKTNAEIADNLKSYWANLNAGSAK